MVVVVVGFPQSPYPICSQWEEPCSHPSLPPTETVFPLGAGMDFGLSKAAPYRQDLQVE